MASQTARYVTIAVFLSGFAFSVQAADGPASMGPGIPWTPAPEHVDVAKSTPSDALAFSPSQTLEIPQTKSASATTDRRLESVGEGRRLSDAGKPDFDVAQLSWQRDGADAVATLRVKSAGAQELRVGLRFRTSQPQLRVRVSAEAGRPIAVDSDALNSGFKLGLIWTPITEGDSQVIEFRVPADHPFGQGEVLVVGVSHFAAAISKSSLGGGAKSVGSSLPCQINVACVDSVSGLDVTTKTAFDNKVNSTALLVITKDSGATGTCTGTLLNNDYHVPVMLTAFHCIGSATEANSVITVWHFQANDCNGSNYNAGDPLYKGGNWLAGSQELDQTLIDLREVPVTPVILSGWDAGGYYPAGTIMLGMHHPRGDLKKTSIGTINGLYTSSLTVEGSTHVANEFYTTNWQIGLAEPGSSGSGLFVQPSGKDYLALIGTLFAGPVGALACSAATTYQNFFSRLDLLYPSVKRFLKSDYSNNFTDLWWNPNESGWGINIQHQGDTLFATWFTYDANGAGMWLVMSDLEKQSNGTYSGGIYRTTGTPFNLINGAQAIDTPVSQVGNAVLSFSAANAGVFSYTMNGISGAKAIQRQQFSTPATCSFTLAGRSAAANYQDLWYNPTEPGWGVNIAHQGNTLFATWFTYDANRAGMWLVMSNGQLIAPNTYQGALYRTTGTPFNLINGAPAIHQPVQQVGTLTFQFSSGSNGTMTYQVNGISGSKPIQRQVFALPVSQCQ